jgi:hypothetical protein
MRVFTLVLIAGFFGLIPAKSSGQPLADLAVGKVKMTAQAEAGPVAKTTGGVMSRFVGSVSLHGADDGSFVPSDSTVYSYAANAVDLYASIEEFSYGNGYKPASRTVYTRAGSTGGTDVAVIEHFSDATQGYEKFGKRLFQVDAQRRVLSDKSMNWDTLGMVYQNGALTSYTYDVNGRVSEELTQTGEAYSNYWENNSRAYYTRNSKGRLTESINQSWSIMYQTWLGSSRTVYTYDSTDTVVKQYLWYNWSFNSSSWVPSFRANYNNNASGKPVKVVYEMFDIASWTYSPAYQYVYQYDTAGNNTELIVQSYYGNAYNNSYKYTYAYNSFGQQTSCEFVMWDGVSWKINAVAQRWVSRYETVSVPNAGNHSPSLGVAVNTTAKCELACVPNPVQDELRVQVRGNSQEALRLVLTDVTGRHVMSIEQSAPGADVSMSTDAVPSGVYTLRAVGKAGTVATAQVAVSH